MSCLVNIVDQANTVFRKTDEKQNKPMKEQKKKKKKETIHKNFKILLKKFLRKI